MEAGTRHEAAFEVLRVLRSIRTQPVDMERDLAALVERVLLDHGIGFDREVAIGPRDRIDVLTHTGIGIEVKAGKPSGKLVAMQLERYAQSDRIKHLFLVVERCIYGLGDEVAGVPLTVLSVSSQWGIAV